MTKNSLWYNDIEINFDSINVTYKKLGKNKKIIEIYLVENIDDFEDRITEISYFCDEDFILSREVLITTSNLNILINKHDFIEIAKNLGIYNEIKTLLELN